MAMFAARQISGPSVNVFTPEVKKAGAPHFRFLCCCWQALGLGGGMEVAGPLQGEGP